MRTRPDHTQRILLWLLTALMALALILFVAQTAAAQCAVNPTGETTVGLRNASSYYLTFYIDRVRKDGVPPGDRSADFVVTPGEHVLYAEATIKGETSSVSTTRVIPKGHVCTWTVTDPPDRESMWAESKRLP
ncbi:MAG TPA: hypothetical protein VFZ44_14540 [Pyrinomonadaceae bacterium]